MATKYMNQFLGFRCAPDVLGAVGKMNKPEKEVTEAMGLARVVKKAVLDRPGEYTVIDMCAGNCLTGILIAHLLPVNRVIAVDIRTPKNLDKLQQVRNWSFVNQNIMVPWINEELHYAESGSKAGVIVVASHSCGELAQKIMGVSALTWFKPKIAIMPCCVLPDVATAERVKLAFLKMSKYEAWCASLISRYSAKYDGLRGWRDKHVTSPCNVIIENMRS